MNKVLGRALFMRRAKPQKAHGTGITKLVVGAEQGFAEGGEVTAPAGIPALGQQYAKMFQTFAGPERTYEQILAERQKALGEGDMGLQTALAIMALGGRIASTPGGLLTAIGKGLPEFSGTVGKAASEQEQRQAAMRMGAMEAAERDRAQRSALGLEGLKTAISQSFTAGQAAEARAERARDRALTMEFQRQQAQETRDFTKLQSAEERAFRTGERVAKEDFDLLTAPPVPYVQIDPTNPQGFRVVGSFKLNREGKYVDENGVEKPADALQLTPNLSKMLTPDLSEPKMAYVPDTTDPTGLRPVQVQLDKKTDRLVLAGTRTPAPENTILRGQSDLIEYKFDGNQINKLIKEGPFKGITVVTDRSGRVQNPEVYTGLGVDPMQIKGVAPITVPPAAVPTPTTAAPAPAAPTTAAPAAPETPAPVTPTAPAPAAVPSVESVIENPERDTAIRQKIQARGARPAAVGDITGQGAQRFIVEARPPSSIPAYDLTAKQREEIMTDILRGERVMGSLYNATQGAYQAVGLGPKLKSIATNVFDPVIPGADLAFTQNEAYKTELRNLGKQIVMAFSNNQDRISVYEQQLLSNFGPNPDQWFANPKTAAANLREIHRLIANATEERRAQLDNRPPLYIKPIPPGTEKEPLTEDYLPFLREMINSGNGEPYVGKFVQFRNGAVGRIPGRPAQ